MQPQVHRTLAFLVVVVVLAAGCDDASTPATTDTDASAAETAQPTTSTVTIKFSASADVRDSPTLKDPLQGNVYGAIYKSEDVSMMGPIDGAESLIGVDVMGVDLVGLTFSKATWTGELAPGEYSFLGFFDVDGNGAETKDPDSGDPVTLALTNKFTVTEGEPADVTVIFELVY